MATQEQIITQTLKQHVMQCRVDADYGYLAVLSDIHEGLNERSYLQQEVEFLCELPDNVKVVIGGDATNTVTRTSKGTVIEETLSGDKQIYALVDDIKPLYDSGKLLGILSGNHPDRVYSDTFISIEGIVASLLGDQSLYKGSQGIVYFNVNKNCYVHYILHKHMVRQDAYDFLSADVVWKEHRHAPQVTPKISISHNLFAKCPVARTTWEIKQPSFQAYPDYIKKNGGRPLPMGYYICQMSGDTKHRMINPMWNEQFKLAMDSGMTV